MIKNDDPRGLISEAYKIEGISAPECRSVFLDWALEPRDAVQIRAAAARILAHYKPQYPEHPMSAILAETADALTTKPTRRGGRSRSAG